MQSLGVIAVSILGEMFRIRFSDAVMLQFQKSWDILDFYMLKSYNDSIEMLSEIIG